MNEQELLVVSRDSFGLRRLDHTACPLGIGLNIHMGMASKIGFVRVRDGHEILSFKVGPPRTNYSKSNSAT